MAYDNRISPDDKKKLELYQQEKRQRSALDELLLANARKSPDEIELATGVPAAQAVERLTFLLRARDWMSERAEERLLIIELGNLIEGVKKRLENVSEQYYSDTANVALRGYEAIGKRMDTRLAITEMEMSEITRVQAEVYIETLNELVQETIQYISEVYPEMDLELERTIISGFQRNLQTAYDKIRSRIRD